MNGGGGRGGRAQSSWAVEEDSLDEGQMDWVWSTAAGLCKAGLPEIASYLNMYIYEEKKKKNHCKLFLLVCSNVTHGHIR